MVQNSSAQLRNSQNGQDKIFQLPVCFQYLAMGALKMEVLFLAVIVESVDMGWSEGSRER